MPKFQDYFSTQSFAYAQYRPHYPQALFEFLASIAPSRQMAWDCGTGTGQAAVGLAHFFDQVIATDPSQSQIDHAARHERITYQVAPAEQTDIPSCSVDVITVAQALHWFDLGRFYREVERVLKPSGVLAVWCYGLLEVSPAIDQELQRFYTDVVGPYWPPERQLVEDRYRSIPFPFAELESPRLFMQTQWALADLLSYLRTWSATQRYHELQGTDPVAPRVELLGALWGPPEEKKVLRWPIHMRSGLVHSALR